MEKDERAISDRSAVVFQWKGSGARRGSIKFTGVEMTAVVSIPSSPMTDVANCDVELLGEEDLDDGRFFNRTSDDSFSYNTEIKP